MSQRAYRDDRAHRLFYYRTSKGSRIHLIIEGPVSKPKSNGSGQAPIQKELSVIKLLSEESVKMKDLEILKAFLKKHPKIKINLVALGGHRASLKEDQIEIFPWESIARYGEGLSGLKAKASRHQFGCNLHPAWRGD